MRFTTAGESHGKALVAILEGIPAGLPLVAEDVNHQLKRRMGGYGRGARMKIEADTVEYLSGVRAGQTLGSPIAMLIPNRDWENWADVMAAEPDEGGSGGRGGSTRRRQVTRPRPGHADLVGVLKYDRPDARDILERASARETAARVACGAVCRRLLAEFGVEIGSHVVELGPVRATAPDPLPTPLNDAADASPVRCLDPAATEAMMRAIDAAKSAGDTLGGIVEVVARGLVLGLGSHVSWDRKLDGRIGQAMMSIPAVKGVEIGLGFEAARRKGSEVHDEIVRGGRTETGGLARRTNRAGGLEGGMTTGEPLVVHVAMKPISTLMQPLGTVELTTGERAQAQSERSDVSAVPAMGVIAEGVLAIVLAQAMGEKFGGDSVGEMRANFDAYVARMNRRWEGLG
ncbi:MAG: chorismate synthase [Gemmatimonadetes bacterium]|nr:chorismate synthase [Gemmatimonadota bacterium]MBI2615075.1 chorismate synthase [Gemmatimonadota bacterium]